METGEKFDVSPREAGDLVGCHGKTFVRWAEDRGLPVWVTPGGFRRYRRSDVLTLVPGADGETAA